MENSLISFPEITLTNKCFGMFSIANPCNADCLNNYNVIPDTRLWQSASLICIAGVMAWKNLTE